MHRISAFVNKIIDRTVKALEWYYCRVVHIIIVLSSNYCIPYLGKSVHVHACHMHTKLDSLKLLFVVWQTVLVLCGDTSAS